MQQAELERQNPLEYRIAGTVDFATVPVLLQQAIAAFDSPETGSVRFDLSAVQACNSAALALLLEIYRQADEQGREVVFSGLPDNLLSIARAYGIEETIRDIS